MNNSFKKNEKLCSKIEIERLFTKNNIIKNYPIKILWNTTYYSENIPAKILISVPKKRIKRAVDRNLLKRRMREVFRLNKNQLYDKINERKIQLSIVIIFQSNKILPYSEIEKALTSALDSLKNKI